MGDVFMALIPFVDDLRWPLRVIFLAKSVTFWHVSSPPTSSNKQDEVFPFRLFACFQHILFIRIKLSKEGVSGGWMGGDRCVVVRPVVFLLVLARAIALLCLSSLTMSFLRLSSGLGTSCACCWSCWSCWGKIMMEWVIFHESDWPGSVQFFVIDRVPREVVIYWDWERKLEGY